MTDKKAKEIGFTHKGRMYGVPIYFFNNGDYHIHSKNFLWSIYLDMLIFLDIKVFKINDSFEIDYVHKLD
ncbi:hypothetical protein [Elizabethkingia sp. 2-6]|uniref:hypothetical protein n=1 Tax=Elizabethkingia sp. 2-6 TaxID=2575699 RepID=UPI0010C22D24|nr:hypothetical protein [Elizabethkingia sp. 2-6]QCO45797.1 hypothetical protein FCS00_05215 [Elizabethkingia sp. 2-6]